MSYTGQEIFNRAIAVIDELSPTGTISDAQVKEYKYRAPYLLDLWQKEDPDIRTTIEFSRKPLNNLLGDRFQTEEHISEDKTFESSEVAKSFYLKASNESDVYIEEYVNGVWVNASGYYSQDDGSQTAVSGLIAISELTNPTKIKGIITATGEKTRIRFSGDYYYTFYNFALFKAAFPTCNRVPEYGEYVKYDMPSNFDSISQITEESPRTGRFHKWENNNELYVNYYFDGILKITYKPNPTKVTDLSQTLEVSESSCISGAYYLAKYFALADQNTDLANVCSAARKDVVKNNKISRPLQQETIIDVYSYSGIWE